MRPRATLRAALLLVAALASTAAALPVAAPPPATAQSPPGAATLALAGGDLAAGRAEVAATAYLDVLTAGPSALREEAWSGLVLAARARGDHAASAQHARALLRHAPGDPDRVRYLRALAIRDGGDADAATLPFRTIEDGARVLSPAAHLRLAQAMAAAGRDAEAAAAFRAAAARADLPDSLRAIARLEGAEAFQRLGRPLPALALLDAAARDTSAGSHVAAQARWQAASLRRQTGDDAWIDGAATLVVAAPHTPYAALALDALEEARIAVAPLQAAYVRYRAREDGPARQHYLAVLDGPRTADEAAAAWFFLAAIAEREGDAASAIDGYGRALDAAPAGWLAPDALWWRALLLQDAGRFADAAGGFARLARDFPASTFAPAAHIAAALARARSGDRDAAIAYLRPLAADADSQLAVRAWGALLILDAPRSDLPHPAAYAPASATAVLAAAGPAATQPLPPAALDEWSVPGRAPQEAPAWLDATFGRPDPASSRATDDPRLALGLALASAAEQSVARAVLHDLLYDYAGRPHDLHEIARRASAAGLPDIGLAATTALLAPLSEQQRLETPRTIEYLAYPLPYAADLLAAARDERLPPLLLAALARHESAFNPQARSPAGALGLTQVMPPTGQAVASALGLPWQETDLLRPDRSLRFGARYLSQQLDRFDGNLLAALAAYNGGPENAQRWLQQQWWPGPEGYIAAIEFAETRTFVERVLETYAWYRYLYAGATAPAIR